MRDEFSSQTQPSAMRFSSKGSFKLAMGLWEVRCVVCSEKATGGIFPWTSLTHQHAAFLLKNWNLGIYRAERRTEEEDRGQFQRQGRG
jgi:hypothetical protein